MWGVCLFGINTDTAIALDCSDPTTTVEMIQCSNEELKTADKMLNDAYNQRRSRLDELGNKLLRDAQRAWIKFRDAECAYDRDIARGGTMAPLLQLGCLTQMTRERTNALLSSFPPLRDVDRLIYWLPGRHAEGVHQCDQILPAKVGLSALHHVEDDKIRLYAHIKIGEEAIDVPIQDAEQESLCGTDISLSTFDWDEGCALLRVDDGLCDALFVTWDVERRSFFWNREN